MSVDAPAFIISRCADVARSDDILHLVHLAFGALTPPSGALKETIDDVAARFRDGLVLIAEADGGLIGSVFAAMKGDGLYLTRMAARPDWQKRGVGRALLAAAGVQARALGAPKLTLRVRINLPDNRAYFERAGFVVTGQGQDPGRPPYHAMERWLGTGRDP